VRILLAGMSNMLFQIVTGLLAEAPENVVVGRVPDRGSVAAQIRASHADVVMMQAAAPGSASAVQPLLYRFPTLKIITIASDGDSGFLHELQQVAHPLRELSAETLRDALRGASGGVTH
jgi:hypothetical protein